MRESVPGEIRFAVGMAVLLKESVPDDSLMTLIQALRRDVPDLRVLVLQGDHTPIVVDDIYVCLPKTGELTPTGSRQADALRHSQRLARQTTSSADSVHLTPRERQVLACIANGATNKHIATELSISLRTVETHRENLTRKLACRLWRA